MKQLLLSEREVIALKESLELYIHVGLGNKEVVKVDKGIKIEDADSLVIACFGIEAKLGENWSAWHWACKKLHEKGDLE